ncbi:MAG: hypothetical protein U0X39_07295 [Bacteroidales bacterium]
MRSIILFAGCFILCFIVSCSRNRYVVNTSGINPGIKVTRVEEILFGSDPAKLGSTLLELKKNHPKPMRYFSYAIHAGEMEDTSWSDRIQAFCTEKLNYDVYLSVKQKYNDINGLEAGLNEAFRYYIYYFPGKPVPEVFTCVTGFNNSIIIGDSTLGIGLDRYLGPVSDFYPRLGIYKYQSDRMTPENILPDCMYAWASTEWSYDSAGYAADNVLASIIHEGKLMYFVRSMLPGLGESEIFGFTESQYKFCTQNEGQMWQYLVEHDLLFSTDRLVIRKLTGEAPFTSFFSNESPGRAAVWVGFRIVESYMKNNRDVSLSDLLTSAAPDMILEKGRYSPD